MSQPKYAYESSQDSVLRPYYQRWLWRFILAALPESLSPNTMTGISTLACALSFLLAAFFNHSPLALVLAALLILVYMTLDNLDGQQARRIGRSSRLGEFLDHWLDTINNGFVTLGACLAAGLPPLLALGVLSLANLAFFSVQWELRGTGVFRMGRIADIEGNTTVAGLYLALAVLGQEFFRASLFPGFPSLAVLIGLGVMSPAILTVFSALSHLKEGRSDFAPILLAHASLFAWALSGGLSPGSYLAAALFLNPAFTTRVICGRLLDRSTPVLDWTVVGALAAATLAASFGPAPLKGPALGILVATALAAVTVFHCAAAVFLLTRPAAVAVPDPSPTTVAEADDEDPLPAVIEAPDTSPRLSADGR